MIASGPWNGKPLGVMLAIHRQRVGVALQGNRTAFRSG
jgi:hypothetical protein